eukprot:199007-Prorocentrum_minimum.AAC.1
MPPPLTRLAHATGICPFPSRDWRTLRCVTHDLGLGLDTRQYGVRKESSARELNPLDSDETA